MERIKSEIKNLIDEWRWYCSAEAKYRCEAYGELLEFINSLQEEPVSKDLEEASDNYVGHAPEIDEDLSCFTKRNAFIAGAKWKEKQCQKTIELAEDRTDAVIEKACEGIKHLLSGYIIRNFNFGDSYDIDRLIDDFKDYMKGE